MSNRKVPWRLIQISGQDGLITYGVMTGVSESTLRNGKLEMNIDFFPFERYEAAVAYMKNEPCHCNTSEYEHVHRHQVTEKEWEEAWAGWADYNDEQ